ncbi:MAG: ADP-glyceromanno-heptose 6-epimerase [Bacteroidales bacterium]|jgi:ADP-L-glycero-D-manno-heptose 6-epimerase|nr:ADP-glyceromanno-heptose 6-epimerase [Bacteroidales bacterium]
MIVITGAAGFIGSYLTGELNRHGRKDLILVDDFTPEKKIRNWISKQYIERVERELFFRWMEKNGKQVDFILHLGARTDTTETDKTIFDALNLNYSRKVWEMAVSQGIPLIYASSAATYGNGQFGYKDDIETIAKIVPLNPYGQSKQAFDQWVLKQSTTPPFWAGFKFFNVFGPNEYHKGRMASVVFHAFHQIQDTGKMQLFRSHHPLFKDGEQMRDFIHVQDVANVLYWFMQKMPQSGIFNLGTGYARPFIALAKSVFKAMKINENIEFIDTPNDIRDKYQYYTQADMSKLKKCGYRKPTHALETAVNRYVRSFLMKNEIF